MRSSALLVAGFVRIDVGYEGGLEGDDNPAPWTELPGRRTDEEWDGPAAGVDQVRRSDSERASGGAVDATARADAHPLGTPRHGTQHLGHVTRTRHVQMPSMAMRRSSMALPVVRYYDYKYEAEDGHEPQALFAHRDDQGYCIATEAPAEDGTWDCKARLRKDGTERMTTDGDSSKNTWTLDTVVDGEGQGGKEFSERVARKGERVVVKQQQHLGTMTIYSPPFFNDNHETWNFDGFLTLQQPRPVTDRLGVNGQDGLVSELKYTSKKAQWDEAKEENRMDFGGRVTEASRKNFILVGWEVGMFGNELVRFGKTGKNTFALDRFGDVDPLSAFGLAVAALESGA